MLAWRGIGNPPTPGICSLLGEFGENGEPGELENSIEEAKNSTRHIKVDKFDSTNQKDPDRSLEQGKIVSVSQN